MYIPAGTYNEILLLIHELKHMYPSFLVLAGLPLFQRTVITITAFLTLGCHFTSFALVIIPPTNQVCSIVCTCTGAIKLGMMIRYITMND